MQKLVKFLNKKWSILIAFIPVVNILYLVFRFLSIRSKRYNISIWSFVVVVPLCLLYLFVPENWDWVVTHLIVSGIVAVIMEKSRGGYELPIRFHMRWEVILICSVFVFIAGVNIWYAPYLSMADTAIEYARKAVDAIVYDDEETWQELIHPVYGTELTNLDAIQSSLKKVITEELSSNNYDLGKTASSKYDVSDGEAVSVAIDLKISIDTFDFNRYEVTVIYQESENGKGIIDIEILDIPSMVIG